MYTDDPVRDFERRERETQAWLDRLPKCDHCHEPIQDDEYYEIEGDTVCSDCLYDYCNTHLRVRNIKD